MKNISALISGVLFGIGLAASGMTDTRKVVGFLDLFGNWIPDLAFVMGGAVLVTAIGYRFILNKKTKPLFEPSFSLPTKTQIDTKLIVGAAIFGIGWGLFGYCPGPALSSVVYLSPVTFIFIAMMIVGLMAGNFASKYFKS